MYMYIYIGYNFSAAEQRLALPTLPKKHRWFYALNTEAEFITEEQQVEEEEKTFAIQGYSVCVLVGQAVEQDEEPKIKRKRKKNTETKKVTETVIQTEQAKQEAEFKQPEVNAIKVVEQTTNRLNENHTGEAEPEIKEDEQIENTEV